MTPKLKTLGMIAAAALALSALLAPNALSKETVSAYFVSSGVGGAAAKIDGSQIETHTLTIGFTSVTCATANLAGEALTKGELSTEIKLEPSYSSCHAVIFGSKKPATFTMNGCYYVLTAKATYDESGEAGFPLDLTKIECPSGKQIELHVYQDEKEETTLCTYDIKAQGPLTGISATNKENTPTTANDVVADINVTGISVTNTKKTLLCTTQENLTATYKGTSTLQATTGESKLVDFQVEAPKRFIFGDQPAIATGENGTAEFTTEKGPIKCTAVHYKGTATNAREPDLTIEPSYEGCTAFGLTTDVFFEGCTFTHTLIANTFGDGKDGPKGTPAGQTHTKGPIHIECPEETKITFTPTEDGKIKCTISIYPGTPDGFVDEKNIAGAKFSEDHVLFTNTLTGINYEVEGSPETCGENGITFINGQLHGEVKVKGFKDEGGEKGKQISFRVLGRAAP